MIPELRIDDRGRQERPKPCRVGVKVDLFADTSREFTRNGPTIFGYTSRKNKSGKNEEEAIYEMRFPPAKSKATRAYGVVATYNSKGAAKEAAKELKKMGFTEGS